MKGEIRALTGLRGVAALWVVIYHYVPTEMTTPFKTALSHGYLAVDLFFMLSGLVMAMSYAHYFENGFRLSKYGVFLVRRFARVYPLYIITTLLVLLGMIFHVAGTHLWPLSHLEAVINLLMIQAWGFAPSVNHVTWSVSAELAAYILFPVLISLTLFSRISVALVAALACYILMLWLEVSVDLITNYRAGPLDISYWYSTLPTLRCLGEFTIGLLVFRASRYPLAHKMAASSVLNGIVVLILAGAMVIPRSDYLIEVIGPLLILGLTGNNVVAKTLASPIPYFLGQISYALYLIHYPFSGMHTYGERKVVPILGTHLGYDITALAYLMIVISLAYLAYRFLELPSRNYFRKFENVFSRQASADVALSEQAGVGDISA